MTLTAIVSDIHGNVPALDAVLVDARTRGAERVWCLGDMVGYGAQPVECVQTLREISSRIIRGNHEQAVLEEPFGFNPLAAQAIRWTREQFLDESGGPGAHFAFLAELPERVDEEEAVLVHGSPVHPLDEYLFREDTIDHLPHGQDFCPKLMRSFRLIDRPCFVGHTHVPGVIDAQMRWRSPADCVGGYDTAGAPCIVNTGSVGQPRDNDTRASYVLFDGITVTFRRVVYDQDAAARLIMAASGLPDLLAQRLLEGW